MLDDENNIVAVVGFIRDITKRKKPDLVILDVMMLGISGFEVCDTVKNVLGLKNVYILLLTARSQKSDRQRGNPVGADGYITKPFDPYELTKVVSNVLGIEF